MLHPRRFPLFTYTSTDGVSVTRNMVWVIWELDGASQCADGWSCELYS